MRKKTCTLVNDVRAQGKKTAEKLHQVIQQECLNQVSETRKIYISVMNNTCFVRD